MPTEPGGAVHVKHVLSLVMGDVWLMLRSGRAIDGSMLHHSRGRADRMGHAGCMRL